MRLDSAYCTSFSHVWISAPGMGFSYPKGASICVGRPRTRMGGPGWEAVKMPSLIFSRVSTKRNGGEGNYGKAKKTQDLSSPPTQFSGNPLRSNLQLMPAGQHGFSDRELVCHTCPIDILHDSSHHVQLLCRKDKR